MTKFRNSQHFMTKLGRCSCYWGVCSLKENSSFYLSVRPSVCPTAGSLLCGALECCKHSSDLCSTVTRWSTSAAWRNLVLMSWILSSFRSCLNLLSERAEYDKLGVKTSSRQGTGHALAAPLSWKRSERISVCFVDGFLDAFSHHYKRVCPSVGRSDHRSVRHELNFWEMGRIRTK